MALAYRNALHIPELIKPIKQIRYFGIQVIALARTKFDTLTESSILCFQLPPCRNRITKFQNCDPRILLEIAVNARLA